MQGYLLGALFFTIMMAVFVLQNDELVRVKYLAWQTPEISIALVALVAALSGALVTFLFDSFRHLKVLRQLQEQKTVSKKLEHKLNQAAAGSSPPAESTENEKI